MQHKYHNISRYVDNGEPFYSVSTASITTGVKKYGAMNNYCMEKVPCIYDKRIEFVGGIRGLNELERRVNSGEMQAAFALYPVSMQQLIAISDTGNIMPPKTTWFEPKLRSGLLINSLAD